MGELILRDNWLFPLFFFPFPTLSEFMAGLNGRRRARGAAMQQRGPSVRAQLGMLKSAIHGHANKLGGTNPPPFTRRPYSTITVEKTATSASDEVVTITQILSALQAQLGTTNEEFQFKIQRVDIWVMPTGWTVDTGKVNAIPTVRARFFSLVPTVTSAGVSTNTLKSLEDIGCPGSSAAVVSYSWPKDQQDMPLNAVAASGSTPVFEYTIATNCTAFIRFHLHWSHLDSASISF